MKATIRLIAALGLGMHGCMHSPGDMPAPPPLTVKVSEAIVRQVTDYADFTGRTAAVESVRLRARVWGHLEKILFVEGADVKKGQVLFLIDQQHYKTALARAEAELAQNQARHMRLQKEHDRALKLEEKNAISKEDLDRITGELAEAAAMVKSTTAQRDTAKLNLDFTEVRAPVSGQVSRAMVTVGNLVESGEMGGTVLTTIMSIDPMYAYFDVDDQTWVKIRPLILKGKGGTGSVQLGLSNEKGYPHAGKLDFIDNQVDPNTGTMRMRGTFANPDRVLTPGLFVRIRVPLGISHEATLVSDRAIDTDQGEKVLYVVDAKNTVEKRVVRLGGLHDGLREIESGIQAKDRVVVEGLQRVRPGAEVAPKVIEMPIAR